MYIYDICDIYVYIYLLERKCKNNTRFKIHNFIFVTLTAVNVKIKF